jgi:Ca-activated chloride channel family protein
MQLLNPLFLWLLIPIWALFFFWKRQNSAPSIPYSVNIPSQLQSFDPTSFMVFLRCLAFSLLVLVLARPQKVLKLGAQNIDGIDIMMLLDVSASMEIEDLATSSRLEQAKATIHDFIAARRNDRIGLSIFSGEPITLVPPTLDYSIVLDSLSLVRTGVLQDGTAIGDGLTLAVNHLKESTAKSRVIILLTDGDNNLGKIDPETAGEIAKGYGIKVYTIAIGKEGKVKMPIRRQGLLGEVVSYQWFENALNPEILRKIAQKTNAKFYRVTDADTLKLVFKEIDQLETSSFETEPKKEIQEVFAPILVLALLFLGLEQVLVSTVWRFTP